VKEFNLSAINLYFNYRSLANYCANVIKFIAAAAPSKKEREGKLFKIFLCGFHWLLLADEVEVAMLLLLFFVCT
jgi:hypothetical protein